MPLVRHVVAALVAGSLLWSVPLGAQDSTGAVTGQVVDGTTQQPLANVEVAIAGTPHRMLSRNDGSFLISGLAPGIYRVRATRIGYGSQVQGVTVTAGGTVTVHLSLVPAAAILEPVVVTGYGTQRREAITGSVSTVSGSAANVGVVANVDQMIQGRAAGVDIIQNNGEPGAGAQILIRGGSSISNSNAPLYVVDGVPINNVPTEPPSYGVGGTPPLPRNPLNLLNPSDIASLTILKDASATAVYGSRAANGVILIETKKGAAAGGPTVEYDSYVAAASPAKHLDLVTAAQYRQFVTSQVVVWRADSTSYCATHATLCQNFFKDSVSGNLAGLSPSHFTALGNASTDWERAVTRTAVTHNHDVSFSGGTEDTRYRASLNYMKDQGVALSSNLERIQGRLTATHRALDNRLRLGVNVTTSRVNNQYLTFENTGGFEGGVFQNVAIFDPTQPITVTDATGTHFYEPGGTSVRNPVALADQIIDLGQTTRTLGNATAELDLAPGVTAQVTVGLDHSGGGRQVYYPNSNPVGEALGGGLARQYDLDNSTRTVQTLLTFRRQVGEAHSFDIVGGYEYNKYTSHLFMAEGKGFFTDAFSFDNLGAAVTRTDSSASEEARLVSFLSRANYGYKDRYFVTGVLRYDGSSKFAAGHKWALFPGLSGSWHVSQEDFLRGSPFSDLRLRLGWGRQGNPNIPPYASLPLLAAGTGGTYPWGDVPNTGVVPTRNANPNLKWEQTTQYNVAVDFGLWNNRLAGSLEYYIKNTSDLLLSVPVPQPAGVETVLENVGKLRNRGLELSLDALVLARPGLTWRTGLVFAAERNKVISLGTHSFLTSGGVSGQGQSGQVSERIMPGYPLGTFYGPVFVGVNANGQQLFRCTSLGPADTLPNGQQQCQNGQDTTARASDYAVIGNANPDFTVGLHNDITWGKFDVSFLLRAAVGQDVFNNTALVYSTKGNALQGKNFLQSALPQTDPTGLKQPAIYSSRWIEKASFLRLQNITVEYNLDLPVLTRSARSAKLYASADNLFVITGYSGLDPEVYASSGLASRGIDYLSYPRPRTVTGGLRVVF